MNLLKISEKKIVNLDQVTDIAYFPDQINYKTIGDQTVEVTGELIFYSNDIPNGHVYGDDAARIWTWLQISSNISVLEL